MAQVVRLLPSCSFWRHVSNLERRETRRYLQMFYCLMMRPLIAKVRTCLQAFTCRTRDAVGHDKRAWSQVEHEMVSSIGNAGGSQKGRGSEVRLGAGWPHSKGARQGG